MDHTESIKRRIYFTEEEYALVRLQAQKRGMKPDKYIKEIALDPSGDSILKRRIATTMSRFYMAADRSEIVGMRNMMEEVAEQLWLYLE